MPTKISSLDMTNITKISAGYHSAAISLKGDLYIWGNCALGEFWTPQKACKNIDCSVVDIKMGDGFTIIIDMKGNVWGFGKNTSGELGNGDFESRNIATRLSSLKNKKVYSISCGKNFALALGECVEKKNQAHDAELTLSKNGKKHIKREMSMNNLVTQRELEVFSISDAGEDSISNMAHVHPSASKAKRDNWFGEEREFGDKKRESLSLDSLDQMIKEKKRNDTNVTEPDQQLMYQGGKSEMRGSIKYIRDKKNKEGESAKKFESSLSSFQMNYSMAGLKNVLADMKILKIQNNLLGEQLEEKSRQKLYLEMKMKDNDNNCGRLADKDKKINELFFELERLQEENKKLRHDFANKDDDITQKNKQIELQFAELDSYKVIIQNLQDEKKTARELCKYYSRLRIFDNNHILELQKILRSKTPQRAATLSLPAELTRLDQRRFYEQQIKYLSESYHFSIIS